MRIWLAAIDHELEALIKYFNAKDRKIIDNILKKTARKHKSIWGYPLVCSRTLKRRKNKKITISSTMDRTRRAARFVPVKAYLKTSVIEM